MKDTRTIVCLLGVLALVVVACAPSGPEGAAGSPGKPTWQGDWEQTLAAGRKEGAVVIYTMYGAEARIAMGNAFKERLGINTEWVTGRSNELAERVLRENRAGANAVDFFMVGQTAPWLYLRPAGVLEPLRPLLINPEVLDPKAWWLGELPFVDRTAGTIFNFAAYPAPGLGLNSDMVKPEEIKSYRDLLHPKWKGKIMIDDPTGTGSGQTHLVVFGSSLVGWDFVEELARHEPILTKDRRQLIEWLARGKYPMGLGLYGDIFSEFQKAGSPIILHTPAEGIFTTPGSGTISLIKGAPHPNAAKIFINWLLTKEGQTVFTRASSDQSARIDAPTDHLYTAFVRKAGVKYFDVGTEDFLDKQGENTKRVEATFKAQLK